MDAGDFPLSVTSDKNACATDAGDDVFFDDLCSDLGLAGHHRQIAAIDQAVMNDDDRTRLRRERIGMVFQTFNLMPTLSGVENVSLPLRLKGVGTTEAADRARQMLQRVGLTDRLTHRPDEMSGGERQRVAIARALVFDPPLLLADEPTGNLDSATGDEILHLLDDIHGEFGTTIILVTHNEHAAEHCERRIKLLDGRIVEDTA